MRERERNRWRQLQVSHPPLAIAATRSQPPAMHIEQCLPPAMHTEQCLPPAMHTRMLPIVSQAHSTMCVASESVCIYCFRWRIPLAWRRSLAKAVNRSQPPATHTKQCLPPAMHTRMVPIASQPHSTMCVASESNHIGRFRWRFMPIVASRQRWQPKCCQSPARHTV